MKAPLVVSVILNTNRRDDTLACLSSLSASDYPSLQMIVLDNASTDGSVEAIHAAHPTTNVITLPDNRGYAGNNNVGIRAALDSGADWVFVLNEDTVLAPDCVEKLVGAGESDERIGIVGPMVYHHDEPNMIQSAGGEMGHRWQAWHTGQNVEDRGQYSSPRRVDWISGCAILVRRAVIEQVGMLDERFFYYWEEVEWCVRARMRGWDIVHVPSAKLWHRGVQRDYHPSPSVTYYSTRNRFLMLAKHRAPITAWLTAWTEVARTLTSWTLKPRWKDMRAHRDAMLRGAVDYVVGRHGQYQN